MIRWLGISLSLLSCTGAGFTEKDDNGISDASAARRYEADGSHAMSDASHKEREGSAVPLQGVDSGSRDATVKMHEKTMRKKLGLILKPNLVK